MRIEAIVFNTVGVFAAGVAVIYWVFSKDPTGTAALALTAGMGLLVGSYLLFTGKRIGMRPQDLPDAEIADGAGELGHFTPGSYYPFFIASSATVTMMGFAFGVWLVLVGFVMTVFFVTCLVFENFWHPPVPED
ncbi:MAG: cytochrome c oxidase subunit 4 [Frankia sp.]|nr:cytochrome c oxidase subunit 4 [Frankia sp.]